MTVNESSMGVSGLYDLSFVATGKYVSISEFIAAIENDSSLNFKIENTKIMPFEGNTENLQATFQVTGISIRIDTITSPKLNKEDLSQNEKNDTPNKTNSNS